MEQSSAYRSVVHPTHWAFAAVAYGEFSAHILIRHVCYTTFFLFFPYDCIIEFQNWDGHNLWAYVRVNVYMYFRIRPRFFSIRSHTHRYARSQRSSIIIVISIREKWKSYDLLYTFGKSKSWPCSFHPLILTNSTTCAAQRTLHIIHDVYPVPIIYYYNICMK